jgi:hypothetical protein
VTFLADYLAGRVDARRVFDHVLAWINGAAENVDLATYLGMTAAEYAVWVERGELPEPRTAAVD